MRVLHIVQPWRAPHQSIPRSDLPDRCDVALMGCRSVVRDLPQHEQQVLVLGGADATRRARLLGLETSDRISPALGLPRLARRAFARYALARGPFDIVHTWGLSLEALQAWHAGMPNIAQVDLSSGELVIVPGRPFGAAPVRHSLPHRALSTTDVRELRDRRMALRAALGVDEQTVVIALLADPPHRGDAARFGSLLALLRSAGLRCQGVMHASSFQAERATSPDRVRHLVRAPVLVEGPILAQLSACDIGVFAPGSRFTHDPEAATWRDRVLARSAMDLGVPVVSATEGLAPEIAQHDLLAPTPHPTAFARTIARLVENRDRLSDLQHDLAAAATTDLQPTVSNAIADAWASLTSRTDDQSLGYTDPEVTAR